MQPTGDSLHLGSYLGALRQWVPLQDSSELFCFVADLHSITVEHDPEELRRRTRATAAQFLAGGVDPARATLFVQSHVPQHAQLSWVLGCLTGFGEARRMTQFKDRAAHSAADRLSVGFFSYPILQAADILIYRPELVPVGEDQRQHLELSRDLAQRFNSRFGETFVVPQAHILQGVGRIYDLQQPDRKMSKSVGGSGCVWLLDDAKTIDKKIRTAVTDAGREITADAEGKPGVTNLLAILSGFTGEPVPALEARLEGRGYGDLKKEVAEAVLEFTVPFAERVRGYLDDPGELDAILTRGAARAAEEAAATLRATYDAVGFLPGQPATSAPDAADHA